MKGLWHRIKKERSAYFFIMPTLLLTSLFLFKPVVEAVKLSFYEANLRTQTFIGIQNYLTLVNDKIFWLEIKNTLIIASVLIPLLIGCSLFIALTVARLGERSQSFYRAAFYLPGVSSGVVSSMVFLWIFNPTYGLLNYLLSLVGLGPIIWLGEPTFARLAVVAVVFNWIIGVQVILYLSALLAIPKSLWDAANIDGANNFQKFFKITLPLITPTTLYILITSTIGAFQIFQAVYLLTAGGPAYTTMTFVYRIYQVGFSYFNFGIASTHATVLLIIIFSISFFQFRVLKRKLEY